jgi:hypothetical protein
MISAPGFLRQGCPGVERAVRLKRVGPPGRGRLAALRDVGEYRLAADLRARRRRLGLLGRGLDLVGLGAQLFRRVALQVDPLADHIRCLVHLLGHGLPADPDWLG